MTDTVARDEITGLWRVTKPGGRGPYAVVDTEYEARAIAGCIGQAARIAELEAECAKLNERDAEMDEGVGLMGDHIAELEEVIAWANNSLFGSHSFFLNGPHSLDSQIEKLKADSRENFARIATLEAENAKLKAALKPFAEYGRLLHGQIVCGEREVVGLWDFKVKVLDFRRAAAALKEGKGNG